MTIIQMIPHSTVLLFQNNSKDMKQKNKFTKTEDILSSKLVQALSAERYTIGR